MMALAQRSVGDIGEIRPQPIRIGFLPLSGKACPAIPSGLLKFEQWSGHSELGLGRMSLMRPIPPGESSGREKACGAVDDNALDRLPVESLRSGGEGHMLDRKVL